MDVFFYEAFEEEAQALQQCLKPHIEAGFTWKTVQEETHREPPARLISMRTQSLLPISWAKKLSGILTRSSGYEHIETYCTQARCTIPCGYLPLYCNRSVAEQVMLLWMALLRKLPQQIRQLDRFCRDGLTGQESQHKTLLVVGVGNIGSEIVQIGKGLGMKVLGVDVVERHASISYTSLEEGLSHAHVIVCAMNLTSENRGYFNYDVLRRARRGAVFVNIARGEHAPAEDLLRLLDEGVLGGVALDVYQNEPEFAVTLREGRSSKDRNVQSTFLLAQRPNVILTPHNAFNTLEAVERKAQQSVQQVERFLAHGEFLWPVPVL